LREKLALASQASQATSQDVKKAQAKLAEELANEKKEYLTALDKQKKLLKNDTTRRVFALLEETEAIVNEENALLDQAVIAKKQGTDAK